MRFLKLLQRKFFFSYLSLIVDAAHHILSCLFTLHFVCFIIVYLVDFRICRRNFSRQVITCAMYFVMIDVCHLLFVNYLLPFLVSEVEGVISVALCCSEFPKMWTLLEAKSRQWNATSLSLNQNMMSWPKDFVHYELGVNVVVVSLNLFSDLAQSDWIGLNQNVFTPFLSGSYVHAIRLFIAVVLQWLLFRIISHEFVITSLCRQPDVAYHTALFFGLLTCKRVVSIVLIAAACLRFILNVAASRPKSHLSYS